MDKRKRKTKPEQSSWLGGLFAPATIDFIAYLPLEECMARLKSREKTGFWSSPKTYVNLALVDADTTRFHIKRTGGKYGTYFAEGYLQRWEGTYTYISGEVRSNPIEYAALPVLLVIALGFLAYAIRYSDTDALFAVFIVGVMGYLSVAIMMQHRSSLAEMIEETLGY